MANYWNNISLLQLLFKWRKQLIILGLVSAVLAGIFSSSFVITPKYQSYAILYPSNIIPMGTETTTEQMLQVLDSDQIRDSIIATYDLYAVYDIDGDKRGSSSAMKRKYASHVSNRKTEFESVIVEVLDTDPVRARDMVNSIIHFFNMKQKQMQREKSEEVLVMHTNTLSERKHEMDSMENALRLLRTEYGILDYELQTEYATERYLDVITTPSKKASAKEIEPLLSALREHGGDFVTLKEHLWRIRGSYNDVKEKLDKAQQDVDKKLTYCNIITSPEIADKKAYPVRWLIVLVSVLGTLLTAFVTIILAENLRIDFLQESKA